MAADQEWVIPLVDDGVIEAADTAARASDLSVDEWVSRAIVEGYRRGEGDDRDRGGPGANGARATLAPDTARLIDNVDREQEPVYRRAGGARPKPARRTRRKPRLSGTRDWPTLSIWFVRAAAATVVLALGATIIVAIQNTARDGAEPQRITQRLAPAEGSAPLEPGAAGESATATVAESPPPEFAGTLQDGVGDDGAAVPTVDPPAASGRDAEPPSPSEAAIARTDHFEADPPLPVEQVAVVPSHRVPEPGYDDPDQAVEVVPPDPKPAPGDTARPVAAEDPPPAAAESAAPPPPPTETAALPPDVPPSVAAYMEAAESGDPDAQHDLGLIYVQGRGVAQDYDAASYWFRESARQGNANAQYNLGVMYERGYGVPEDRIEALLLYLAAAERGHLAAQYNAGLAYAEGNSVPRNFAEARRWFLAAAEQGLPEAQYNLGVIYENGLGVARDYVAAYRYYGLAAVAGHDAAEGRLVAIGDRLSAEQLETAQGQVVEALAPAAAPQAGIPATGGRSTVAAVQRMLAELGYDPGPADGIAGARTVEAIRAYQRAEGLVVDGQASASLRDHLQGNASD